MTETNPAHAPALDNADAVTAVVAALVEDLRQRGAIPNPGFAADLAASWRLIADRVIGLPPPPTEVFEVVPTPDPSLDTPAEAKLRRMAQALHIAVPEDIARDVGAAVDQVLAEAAAARHALDIALTTAGRPVTEGMTEERLFLAQEFAGANLETEGAVGELARAYLDRCSLNQLIVEVMLGRAAAYGRSLCSFCGKFCRGRTEIEAHVVECALSPLACEVRALRDNVAHLESVRDDLADEAEQRRVQLAGCLVVAEGATNNPAKQGDYGWSLAYQRTLDLRLAYDAARTAPPALAAEHARIAAQDLDAGPLEAAYWHFVSLRTGEPARNLGDGVATRTPLTERNAFKLAAACVMPYDFAKFLDEKTAWARETFGPQTPAGLVAHIRKELAEIEADPTDLVEWIDLILLAVDGAMRVGATATGGQVVTALAAKMDRNRARTWPDWRALSPDAPREHDRSSEGADGWQRWRKRPVVIDAFRYRAGEQPHALAEYVTAGRVAYTEDGAALIHTLEGTHRADPGDWIIRGVAGELYPCKPSIFERTYEPA